MNRPEEPSITSGGGPKKPYSAPKFTNYGCVSKLTQGGGFIGNDGNTKCDTGQASASQDGCVPS